jgi:voltage-gated potassium channel
MTDDTDSVPDTQTEVRAPVRTMVVGGLRALASTAVLVAVYYLLPLDHTSIRRAATVLVIGLVALIVLVSFQVRTIMRSPFPGLRAIEALATSLPLFLLLFSGTYLVMAATTAGTFGHRLTHTDALYFTVTVFSTVGFGDITAKSDGARLLVTAQMVLDLVILGIGAKIIFGAVTRGRQKRPAPKE